MQIDQLKTILEALIMGSEEPISLDKLLEVFTEDEAVDKSLLLKALTVLSDDYQHRGISLQQVASGYRFQVHNAHAHWLQRLNQQRIPRYSRALLETLALIAYRQPITRAEIEEVRGVAVSTHIIKTLNDREWIKIVGHRELPGRPALYATTQQFLDYFNLKSLEELPQLLELQDFESITNRELESVETVSNSSEELASNEFNQPEVNA